MAVSQYAVRINAEGMDAYIADMQRGGAGTDALTNAQTRLVNALPGVATGLTRTQEEARKTAESMRTLGTAKDAATSSSGRLTQALGQAGFQVQDFTVQVAGGQSALLAFAQQGSQLAGIFGPAGAIAGAALAIGAIAAQLLIGKTGAEAFAEAMKQQAASFKEATTAADTWREGLAKEATQVLELRQYYQSLSTERQGYEVRALERQREELNRQTEALKTRVERPLGGLVNTAQLDQANAAAAGLPAEQRELYLSNPDLQRMRDAVEVLKTFRAEGTVTEDSLAVLSARFRELAGDSGDAFSRRLRSSADELEKNGPQARELAANVAQLEQRFRGLTGELTETERKLRALRGAAADNPLGALNTEAASLDQRLQALRGGGLVALERVTTEQEKLTEITRRATAAQEAHAKALQASTGDAVAAAQAAKDMAPQFMAAAARVVEANAALVTGKKAAEEAQRAAERAARAGASAARSSARAEDREEERFDLTHLTTPVLNPASGLLSFGGDDDKTQAQIRRNVDVAERAAAKNAEAQKRALEQQERAHERSTDSVVRYAGDAFADLFEKNGKGWAGFLDTVESTAKKTFARIAAEAIIRPIVSPLIAGLTGSGGGNMYQGLANTFGFGQVAGLFGGFGGGSTGGSSGSSGSGAASSGSSSPVVITGQGGATPRVAIGGGAGMAAASNGGGVSLMDAGGGLYKIVNGGGAGGTAGASIMPSGISNFLNTPIYTTEAGQLAGWSGQAIANVDKTTSAGFGMTYGSALGAGASIAGGAYGVYSGLQRGGVGGYTTAAGGAIGIASGAVAAGVGTGLIGASSTLAMLGPYGMIAAAVLAVIGSLLPGAKPSNKTGTAAIDLQSGTTEIYGQTGSKFSAENRESANSLAQGVKTFSDSIAKLTGTPALGRVTVDVGSRDGLGLAVSTAQGVRQGLSFSADEAGQAELMRHVGAALLEDMSTRMEPAVRKAVSGVSQDSAETILTGLAKIAEATNGGKPTANQNLAAANIDFGNLDAGLADLKWAGTYESLTAPKQNPFEAQMTALAATWQSNIDKANRLGLATEGLATAYEKARGEVSKAQTDAARAAVNPLLARNLINMTGNNFDAQLFLADRNRETELEAFRKQLEDIGMSAADIAARVAMLAANQAAERVQTLTARDEGFAALTNPLLARNMSVQGRGFDAQLFLADKNRETEGASFNKQLLALGMDAGTIANYRGLLNNVQDTERAQTFQARDQTFSDLTGALGVRGANARGDPNAELMNFDLNAAIETRNFAAQLGALGLSAQQVAEQMAELGKVQADERKEVVKRLATPAETTARNGVAKNLLEQLAIGQLGGMTGETRYFAGMQSLTTAQRGLADGGAAGVTEYARVAQLVLPVLREYLGTSERYGAITSDVAGNLSRYAPGGDTANLATLIEAQTTGSDQLTNTLLSTSGVTNDLLSRIQTDINRLTGQIAAVMARAA